VISLLLEIAGNTNAHVLKIDRACFYCLLRLEIIGCSNKSLWNFSSFPAYVDTISQYSSSHINALISVEKCFSSHV